jgi:protein involved in polysaccharide export with SLBB domain
LTAVDSSLLEVMTKAGGLSRTASKQIVLVRPRRDGATAGGGAPLNGYAILHLDLEKIQESYQKGDPSGNIRLQNEDTIFVPKVSSYFVLGEVRKAGTFPLTGKITAFDAILAADGFKETAVQSAVKVLRRGADGKQEALSIDLSGGPQGRDRDFAIRSGDTLVVPRGNSFFVFGEVKSPGAYHLDGNLNLLDAIVRAGGFTVNASPGRTRVLRNTPQGRQVIYVDMNDVIKRGQREKAIAIRAEDVIIVPESFF